MKSIKKHSKKILIAVALLAVLFSVALYHVIGEKREIQPDYVFSYAENQPEDYPTTQGAYRFAELVEERTEGRIRILVQAEGAMGTEKEVIEQVQFGGIDFARVSLSQLAEYIPELNVLQMPYLYNSSEHMWEVLDGEIGNHFIDVVDQNEMVGLSWYDAGARSFYNSVKPITCVEDLAGMTIRVQESEMMADMVEALGANAVQVDYASVYSSLERGLVDGAENNWPSYLSMQHYEVAKYFTEDEHTRVPEMQICSESTWNKLSAEDQQILKDCAAESALYERELWGEREEQSRQRAIRNGVECVELSMEEKERFQEAMTGVYEKYCGNEMDIINQIIEVGKNMK